MLKWHGDFFRKLNVLLPACGSGLGVVKCFRRLIRSE